VSRNKRHDRQEGFIVSIAPTACESSPQCTNGVSLVPKLRLSRSLVPKLRLGTHSLETPFRAHSPVSNDAAMK